MDVEAVPRAQRRRSVMLATIPALVILALGTATAAPTAGATQASSDPPSCALGRLPTELTGLVHTYIDHAQARFVTARPAARRRRLASVLGDAIAAYVYGMPAVLVRETVQRFPRNAIIGIGQLATPEGQAVVSPNHDTLYSTGALDLGDGPLVIDAPATGRRYSVLQLLDAYSNDFAYIGGASAGAHASTTAVVPPEWTGVVPAGVRVLRSPTRLVWLLGRTLASGSADIRAADQVLHGYAVTPLQQWLAGTRNHAIVLSTFPPQKPVTSPRGVAFFDEVGTVLAEDPPPARDACALRAFATAGDGPGRMPSRTHDAGVRGAFVLAESVGRRLVDAAVAHEQRRSRRAHHGWLIAAADVGRFGTDYARRAMTARTGLASNTRSQAMYSSATADRHGHELDGRRRYTITFRRGSLPPVYAFWSLTLYNSSQQLWPNPLQRYSIGDRTPHVKYAADGSLTIYIQHDQPPVRERSNWLPAPRGRFVLWLRLYKPRPAATAGRWQPPVIDVR